MRFNSLIFALVVVMITPTLKAQDYSSNSSPKSTTTKSRSKSHVTSEGFRFAFLKPSLNFKADARFWGFRSSGNTTVSDTMGFSAGYAYLPTQKIGFLGGLSVMTLKEKEDSVQLMRLDGNIGFAMSEYIYAKGGGNFSKFTSGKYLQDLTAALGFQAALGVQITKNFGFELGYTEMNQTGTEKETGYDIAMETKQTGFEASLHATF